MRVNVYTQELTHEVELVRKAARDTGIFHYGLRFWMHSPDVLHSEPDDDDRSAVTFWLPQTTMKNRYHMAALFVRAANICLPPRDHVNSVQVPQTEQDEPFVSDQSGVATGVERGPSLIGGDAPYRPETKEDTRYDQVPIGESQTTPGGAVADDSGINLAEEVGGEG